MNNKGTAEKLWERWGGGERSATVGAGFNDWFFKVGSDGQGEAARGVLYLQREAAAAWRGGLRWRERIERRYGQVVMTCTDTRGRTRFGGVGHEVYALTGTSTAFTERQRHSKVECYGLPQSLQAGGCLVWGRTRRRGPYTLSVLNFSPHIYLYLITKEELVQCHVGHATDFTMAVGDTRAHV